LKTPVDSRLTAEAARFALRFACEDCVHFDPDRNPTCGHGWPIRLRRSALEPQDAGGAVDGGAGDAGQAPQARAASLDPKGRAREPVAFCKEFELS
jgi:hypothetical protein